LSCYAERPDSLRPRGHDYVFPVCSKKLHKQSFLVRSFFDCLIILCYVTLSKLHFSSVLLFYYVRLSHILLNTVLLCYCVTVLLIRLPDNYSMSNNKV